MAFLNLILIVSLLGCGLWIGYKTRFVQFRHLKEMFRVITESSGKEGKHISSFQAFTVSLASRVGTGNLAGVATALTIGGPGAVFWMWLMALLGSGTSFIESTLAQLYKRKSDSTFIGGPAYYMERGLGKRWMGVIFAVLTILTFGFAFPSVQSNTIAAAWDGAFGITPWVMGIIITILTALIIFGGIRAIARVSSVIVPFMAVGYIMVALIVIAMNFSKIPHVFGLIFSNAFGWHQVAGGGFGVVIAQGIKRGLFSNEAGMGSAPNVAATATTTHPVKQGLIQALGVFTDTILICSCTAFMILISGVSLTSGVDGVQLTQEALTSQIGGSGAVIIAFAILLLAFSTIIGNCYYAEANIIFITKNKIALFLTRLAACAMVFVGSIISLDTAWAMADVTMAMMAIVNLIAIVLLGKQAFDLLKHYEKLKAAGVKSPEFHKEDMPEIQDKIEVW